MATKKNVKTANTNRAKKASEHAKQTQKRAEDEASLRAAYRAGDGEVILADLRKKIPMWQSLNTKIAQDGVGARPTGYKLEDGSQEVENIYFMPEQRVTYLDKNAGMQSILDYIERKFVDDPNLPEPKSEVTGDPALAIEPEDEEEAAQLQLFSLVWYIKNITTQTVVCNFQTNKELKDGRR